MKRLILVYLLGVSVSVAQDITPPLQCNNQLVEKKFTELYDEIFKDSQSYFVEMKQIKEIAYDKKKNLRACAAQFVAHFEYHSGQAPYETRAFYYDLTTNKLIMKLRQNHEILLQ